MRDVLAACAGFAEDLSALLDGELLPERERALRAHVDGCEDCTERLAALARVDLALASAPLPALPDDLRARLDARIAREKPQVRPRADAAARRTAPRTRRRWLGAPALGLAAAAAAALALYLALRPGEATRSGAPIEEPRVAERRRVEPSPELPQVPEAPPRPAPAPAPPREIAQVETAEPSDEDLEELALALELDTLEDLDVIANLDLIERLLALEDEARG